MLLLQRTRLHDLSLSCQAVTELRSIMHRGKRVYASLAHSAVRGHTYVSSPSFAVDLRMSRDKLPRFDEPVSAGRPAPLFPFLSCSVLESYKSGHPLGWSPLMISSSIDRNAMASKYISYAVVSFTTTSRTSGFSQRQAVLGLPESTKQRVLEALLQRINEADWQYIRGIIEQEAPTEKPTEDPLKKHPRRNRDLIRRVRASGHVVPNYKDEPEGSSSDGEDSHLVLVRRYREECGAQADC